MKTMQIHVDGRGAPFEPNTTMAQAVRALWPDSVRMPMAVEIDGHLQSLGHVPNGDTVARLVDYTQEEGRRIYERSLRFLFILAVHQLMPQARVRIEHSISYGLYIDVEPAITPRDARRIEERMRELQAQDLPFRKERWTREQAMQYFEETGQMDKVRLLGYREHTHFFVYECGGMYAYFYGLMLPSTGWLSGYSVRYHLPGVVLQMPAPEDPKVPAPFVERPKLMRVFAQSAKWGRIMGCTCVSDLNDLIAQGKIRDLVRINEALHDKTIASIADAIVRRGTRVVLIAGPSSSGKTTFTHRLAIHLRVNGLEPVILSLDNYYKSRDECPREPDGTINLESLDALDVPLLNEQLVRLLRHEVVDIPRFDFHAGRRAEKRVPMQLAQDQPILIEGIHGLNPELSEDVPLEMQFRIYVSALTTINLDDHNRIRTTEVRLLRRLVRDYQFRGSSVEETFGMWPSVRQGEERYIFPFQEEADVMFNSTLLYEISILKKYIYPMLVKIEADSPHYPLARRLVKFLNYFAVADVEDEVGPTSILREFIGGCTFYRG